MRTRQGKLLRKYAILLGALVGGTLVAGGGRPRVVFEFTITSGKIVAIDPVFDPERLSQLDVAVLDD